jgi:hypothetical protein
MTWIIAPYFAAALLVAPLFRKEARMLLVEWRVRRSLQHALVGLADTEMEASSASLWR